MNKTLKSAFPIVAAALGNKFGVAVNVGGQEAFTDGNVINLPSLAREDEETRNVAWGYLAHEAAHIRFTDFNESMVASSTPLRQQLANILEDVRIEKLMQFPYPGTKTTIGGTISYIFRNRDENDLLAEDKSPASVLLDFLLFRLRHDVLDQKVLARLAAKSEEKLESTFPAGAVTRLFGLLSEVPKLDSTRACVRLADQIIKMIEEEYEKEQQQNAQNDDQDSASQSGQQEGSQGQGQSDASQDQNGKGQYEGQDQQDDGTNPASDASQSAGQADDAQDDGMKTENLGALLSSGDDDIPQDAFEMAEQLLSSLDNQSYDDSLIMPNAEKPWLDESSGNAIYQQVMAESGKIRASLQGLVQANLQDRSATTSTGIKLAPGKLHRLSVGDPRVFSKRVPRKAVNTAIHILLDGSGSMAARDQNCGNITRIEVATEASLALTLALEGIHGVNPAVTRFPHRNTGNVTPLLQHGRKVRQQIGAFHPVVSGSTPLHSALWYAAAALMQTREDRKIIMVITDGDPDSVMSTRDIISRCQSAGIELVGIGIGVEVGHLFDNAVVINSIAELRTAMFNIGKSLLIAA